MTEENLDKNIIHLAININQQRKIGFALIDTDRRLILISNIDDNEHYSDLETILLQNIQSNKDTQFRLLLLMPDVPVELQKVSDILDSLNISFIKKTKKEFELVHSFVKLLDQNFNLYQQESIMLEALSCVDCIVNHLQLDKDPSNEKQFKLQLMKLQQFMRLDLAAINALLIFPKSQNEFEQKFGTSLLSYLDQCKTAIGQRCLNRWLRQPCQNSEQINKRLDLVQELIKQQEVHKYLVEQFLKKISDLDKLYFKFYKVKQNKKHNASLADCVKVYNLVQSMHRLYAYLNRATFSQVLNEQLVNPLNQILGNFAKLEEMVEKSIDLQKSMESDYKIKSKFSQTLNKIDEAIQKQKQNIEALRSETSENLKVNIDIIENSTYTFLFEGNKKDLDEAFRLKGRDKQYKTISVKQRQLTFTCKELQAEVSEFNNLQEEYTRESQNLIQKILEIVSTYYPAMEQASSLISELDVLSSFALVASNNPKGMVRPEIGKHLQNIELVDCRHPLLETIESNCVANDCVMDKENSRMHIITGPNMGGKSTFIRSIAITVLMAHIGSYVPCKFAKIPIIDAIITRVGASDMQIKGISTFMSEMLEASCMLKVAQPNSLIIIDELGRGTSTSEGFGLAHAICSYIVETLGSFCLCATHFHEMTALPSQVKGAKNYYVSCAMIDGKLNMQYKVREGAVDRSYGLYVAKQLNFPTEVIHDAELKALELETFEQNFEHSNVSVKNKMQIEHEPESLLSLARNATLNQKEQIIKYYEKAETQKLSEDTIRKEIIGILKQDQ